MSHPNPQEGLQVDDYLVPAGDEYKISIINFMHDDKQISVKALKKGKNMKYKIYPGVRDADIRFAENKDGETFLGQNPKGDIRLTKMLRGLVVGGQIKRTGVPLKKKKGPKYYYTLTENGEEFYEEIQKLMRNEKVSRVLYCLKDQNLHRAEGSRWRSPFLKKSELDETMMNRSIRQTLIG